MTSTTCLLPQADASAPTTTYHLHLAYNCWLLGIAYLSMQLNKNGGHCLHKNGNITTNGPMLAIRAQVAPKPLSVLDHPLSELAPMSDNVLNLIRLRRPPLRPRRLCEHRQMLRQLFLTMDMMPESFSCPRTTYSTPVV